MTVYDFPMHETKDRRAGRLWRAYVDAAKKAQASLRLEDGLAAGRAWRDFLKEFEGA